MPNYMRATAVAGGRRSTRDRESTTNRREPRASGRQARSARAPPTRPLKRYRESGGLPTGPPQSKKRKTRASDERCNVQVAVRCRPVVENIDTRKSKASHYVRCNEKLRSVQLEPINANSYTQTKTFTFDAVYGPHSSQGQIFDTSIRPILDDVLKGFNCTVFAYGQTGTGKTYTMEGENMGIGTDHECSAKMGVIPRAVHYIFEHLAGKKDHSAGRNEILEINVRVTHMEIYNEEIFDLLSDEEIQELDIGKRNQPAKQIKILEVKSEEATATSMVVRPLEELHVKTPQDIFCILKKSLQKRRVAQTRCNDRSSRSHSIFTITIRMTERNSQGGEDLARTGTLNLVDLAGSESIKRSGAKGTRAAEAGCINQSLLTLGRVIESLVERNRHVPYRDSKLTRILKESLGGKNKTLLIATFAERNQLEETLSTLEYANRAKKIQNKPEMNKELTQKRVIEYYQNELDALKKQLAVYVSHSKCGFRKVPHEQYEKMETDLKRLQAEVKTLTNDGIDCKDKLEFERAKSLGLERALGETKGKLKESEQRNDELSTELDSTRQELAGARERIAQQEREIRRLTELERELRQQIAQLERDRAALLDKVQRHADNFRRNRDTLDSRKAALRATVGQMDSSCQSFVSTQTGVVAELGRDLAGFCATRTQDLSAVSQQLAGIAQSLKKCLDGIRSLNDEHCRSVEGAAAALEQVGTQSGETLKARVVRMMASISGSVESVRSSVESNVAKLVTHKDAVVRVLQDAQQKTDGFLEASLERIGKAEKVIEEGFTMFSGDLDNFSRDMTGAFSSLKSATETRVQGLLQTIQTSVGAFLTAHLNELGQAQGKVNQHVAGQRAVVSNQRGAFQSSAQSRRQEVQSFRTQSASLLAEGERSVAGVVEHIKGDLESMARSHIDRVAGTVRTGERELLGVISTNTQRFKDGARDVHSLSAKCSAGMQERLGHAGALDAPRDAAREQIGGLGRDLEARQQQWDQSIKSSQRAFTQHTADMGEREREMKQNIGLMKLSELQRIGRTPQRRPRASPAPPAATGPPSAPVTTSRNTEPAEPLALSNLNLQNAPAPGAAPPAVEDMKGKPACPRRPSIQQPNASVMQVE